MRTLIFAIALLVVIPCYAFEIDPYTYYNVPLRDMGTFLSEELNRDVDAIVKETNRNIAKDGVTVSDSEMEHLLAKAYLKLSGNPYMNKWEGCVLNNNCPGWPYVERILPLPEETIYWEADYNHITKNYLAPTFQACGVRIGADKVAHMLMLGFRLYNMWAVEADAWDDERLYDLNVMEEESVQGGAICQVVSHADIEADMRGLYFFRDLFWRSKYLARHPVTGFLHQVKRVNICDYINENWDEAKNPNKYTGKQAARLQKAIDARIASPRKVSRRERHEILQRRSRYTNKDIELIAYVIKVHMEHILSKDGYEYLRKLYRIFPQVPSHGRRTAVFDHRP